MDLRYVQIDSITHYPTEILNYTVKTKVRLRGHRNNYWALDKLEEFNEDDLINLTYQMVLVNDHIHHWISSISKINS